MREPSSPTTAPAATRRRSVGPRWPGVYQRDGANGKRRLEVDYYDEAGRRRWHSLPAGTTLAQATAARERLRVRRREGERFQPAKSPTIAESWPRWLDEAAVSLRPRTVAGYRHAFAGRIVPRIGRVRVGRLDRHDVLGLIRSLQRGGLAPWTIRGTLVPLALFCSWAEDEGLRSGNPVRELRRRERPRVAPKPHRQLTAADLWRLVEAADDERRAFVALLAFAGLRVSEALALTWADVDLDGRVLHVRRQLERKTFARVEPKTARGVREVELDDGLASVLRAWQLRSGHCSPGDFVVATASGRPLDHRAAGRRLDTIVRRAGLDVPGLPRVTPHQCRYSFGSLLIDAGESTARVSRLLGHANEAITGAVYVHEIERRDGGEKTRAAMRAAFGHGTDLERTGAQERVNGGAHEEAKVAQLGRKRER